MAECVMRRLTKAGWLTCQLGTSNNSICLSRINNVPRITSVIFQIIYGMLLTPDTDNPVRPVRSLIKTYLTRR